MELAKARLARFPLGQNPPREGRGTVSARNRRNRGGRTSVLRFDSVRSKTGTAAIGRAIAARALAEVRRQPTLIALAATILARRKQYYAALAAADKSNEITAWLLWFAAIGIEAQLRAIGRVEFLIDKTRLLDRLREQFNDRQEKALLRLLRDGPEGFTGGLSAGNYAAITDASPATTTRDLTDMVAKGALNRVGEHRHARYYVA